MTGSLLGLIVPPPSPPLIIKSHVPFIIHDIVIIIWEDHVYDQESLIIYKNTIVMELIIDVKPMDIIIYVLSTVYTLSHPLAYLFMVT